MSPLFPDDVSRGFSLHCLTTSEERRRKRVPVSSQKLLQHVEQRLVGCLAHRCSTGVLRDIRDAQRHMIGNDSVSLCPQTLDDILLTCCMMRVWLKVSSFVSAPSSDSVRPLLSLSVQEQLFAPSSCFELTYDLGLAVLCADFQENIEFQFSLGWTALVARFIGAANTKRALSGCEPRPQVRSLRFDPQQLFVSVVTLCLCRMPPALRMRWWFP